MGQDGIGNLKLKVERMLSEMFDLYGSVLRIAQQTDHGQLRIQKFFSRAGQAQIMAYAPICDGVCFGFNASSPLKASITASPREGDGDAVDGTFQNRVRVEIHEGGSGWFSLEIALPWSDIRMFRTLNIQMAASAEPAMSCNTALRVFDQSGGTVDLTGTPFVLDPMMSVVNTGVQLAIPHDVVIDHAREPVLLIFFEPRPAVIDLEFMSLRPS